MFKTKDNKEKDKENVFKEIILITNTGVQEIDPCSKCPLRGICKR